MYGVGFVQQLTLDFLHKQHQTDRWRWHNDLETKTNQEVGYLKGNCFNKQRQVEKVWT